MQDNFKILFLLQFLIVFGSKVNTSIIKINSIYISTHLQSAVHKSALDPI
jgi:hypothetical protein